MNPELAPFEVLAKEILRRCMADDDPGEIREWILDRVTQAGGGDPTAVMTWEESFAFTDQMLAEYEAQAQIPEHDQRILSWPWVSWRNLIDPLEDGMLGVVSAPDGAGKTIYAESVAEYWASQRNRVVFVHYELNRKLMMLRRLSRHTSILVRTLKAGKLTETQKREIDKVSPRLLTWDGYITYVHTPGWSMERTTAELKRLQAEGKCDVAVIDYLEKVSPSPKQLRMFGTNIFAREADNVEQLKNFSESSGVPVLMVTQMNKEGKKTTFDQIDRTAMRGAGEKSEKANLVVILNRERVDNGYSNTVNVLIDKNTMGGTGSFRQVMQPEYFRVGDIA